MKRVLYVEGCRDGTVGGSHTCLYSMVTHLSRERFHPVVAFYDDHYVAENLRRQGVETLIVRRFDPISWPAGPAGHPRAGRLDLPAVLLRKAVILSWCLLAAGAAYARFLKTRRIELLHLNNSVATNHEWMLAAKIARVKVLTHQRGISEHPSRTERFFARRLDAVICISKALCAELARRGVRAEKLRVIYDGIDPERVRPARTSTAVRRSFDVPPDSPVIGVVGNIKEWKGQETVVRATAVLRRTWPDIRCLLVGGTVQGDPYKNRLDQVIQELDIGENVIFTGYQKNPFDLMGIMDVVVHASIAPEPFGMVNLEAMCLKRPVVSTNIGGPTEVFRDGQDGILIEPGDADLLARKVSALLADPAGRARMGEKAFETVARRFGIADTVQRIEQTYEEILAR